MADKDVGEPQIEEEIAQSPKKPRFESISSLLKNKNLMTWLPVILLAIALPITVVVAQNQQTLRNFAASDTGNLSPTTIPIPTLGLTTKSLLAEGDAYVRSDAKNDGLGGSTRLYTNGSPRYVSFLKFNLTPYAGKTITKAILRVKVADTTEAPSLSSQSIREVSGSWSEDTLNYNNMPSLGATINTFVGSSRASYYDIDLTPWAASNVGKTASIAIENASNNNLILNSKEATTGKPTLIITYQ